MSTSSSSINTSLPPPKATVRSATSAFSSKDLFIPSELTVSPFSSPNVTNNNYIGNGSSNSTIPLPSLPRLSESGETTIIGVTSDVKKLSLKPIATLGGNGVGSQNTSENARAEDKSNEDEKANIINGPSTMKQSKPKSKLNSILKSIIPSKNSSSNATATSEIFACGSYAQDGCGDSTTLSPNTTLDLSYDADFHLDLFATFHPDAEEKPVDDNELITKWNDDEAATERSVIHNERDDSTMALEYKGGSYFVTSPRSFLLGKKSSRVFSS